MKRIKKNNLIKKFRKARTRAKLFGTAERPRVSIFRSNKYIYIQLINDQEGKTLASAYGKKGNKNTSDLGKKIAELAKKSGAESVIFDRGYYKYHGQIKSVADSMRTSGLKL